MKPFEILEKIDNAIFVSKEEEDTIEHVDMSYSELMKLLTQLVKLAEK